MPTAAAAQTRLSACAPEVLSGRWVTSVPHTIMSSAMLTGAITGPHQGSGSRKRMSQSNSDAGQPDISFRNT